MEPSLLLQYCTKKMEFVKIKLFLLHQNYTRRRSTGSVTRSDGVRRPSIGLLHFNTEINIEPLTKWHFCGII